MIAAGGADMGLTLSDWIALPDTDDLSRLESAQGEIVVVPPPETRHTIAGHQLWNLLEPRLPAHLRVAAPAGVLLVEDPLTARVPDLVVYERAEGVRQHTFRADHVHLVVEILSPSDWRTDRSVKLHEYAAAGIGEYWILDLDAQQLSTFRLDGAAYAPTGEHTGTVELDACGTHLTLDVQSLGR
jgi:Uma2 family endonuclease